MMRARSLFLVAFIVLLGGYGAMTGLAEPEFFECGDQNYLRLDGRGFRYLSAMYYCPPSEQPLNGDDRVLARFPVEALLGDRTARQRPRDLRVIDGLGRRQPFCVLHKESPVPQDKQVRAGDVLCVGYTHDTDTPLTLPLFLLSGGGALPEAAEYGLLAGTDRMRPIFFTENDWQRGLLDTTGLVDLRQPASRIQMDLLYSARWNLWHEFALWTQMPYDIKAVPPMLAVPYNKLTERTHFNMDDVPRFPLYYLRYFKLTGDRDALRRARQGLQAIIDYTRPDGTMPYMLAPWNGKHSPPGQAVDTYHSIRAMAEGIPAFRHDRAFADKLRAEYELLRSFAYTKLTSDLFFGRASCNGALVEAAYHRWLDTKAEREMQDIRRLADAILTPEGRAQMQMSDFGESIPWVPLGLARAYQATSDRKYLRETELWLRSTILPSLKQDRRYYSSLPDLRPSGPTFGENPLSIWYHTDAFMTLYEATGNKRYYDLAAWVYGDYYDLDRYGERVGARIVDTGNQVTECWGNACAEDALRMIAKYTWQLRYPSLYSDSRAKRDDKTGPDTGRTKSSN